MNWKDITDPILRRKEYKLEWNRIDRLKNYDKVIRRERKSRGGEGRDIDNWIPLPLGKKTFRQREHMILQSAKTSARKKNHELTITVEDIVIPTHCPILGVEIDRDAKRCYNSPSIDRIDPSKGYTKDNIHIISWRANLLKSNMTLEECEKLLYYFKNIRKF